MLKIILSFEVRESQLRTIFFIEQRGALQIGSTGKASEAQGRLITCLR